MKKHETRMVTGKAFCAVVFDMDGIIFDTERLIRKCWKIIGDRHHLSGVQEACMAALGYNYTNVVRIFKEHLGADFPFEAYQKEVRELYFGEMYGEHLPFKHGVVHLLAALKEQDIPVALATSTSKELVVRELTDAGIIQYFDEIVCGDMVTHSKPHPETFLIACEKLGVAPETAFAIEDSFNGIRSASSGGLRTIMVPDLLEPTEEIRGLTELVCRSLDEVYDYILGE